MSSETTDALEMQAGEIEDDDPETYVDRDHHISQLKKEVALQTELTRQLERQVQLQSQLDAQNAASQPKSVEPEEEEEEAEEQAEEWSGSETRPKLAKQQTPSENEAKSTNQDSHTNQETVRNMYKAKSAQQNDPCHS
eukprot:329940_1